MQMASLNPSPDGCRAQPGIEELGAADHPELPLGYDRDSTGGELGPRGGSNTRFVQDAQSMAPWQS
jgi:hypothetical protein